MKLSKAEYEELIRKKPSLRPTEVIKSQNTHKTLVGVIEEPMGYWIPKAPIVPEISFLHPPTLKFTIPGQPIGKPRQTQSDRWKKRPCVMRYRAWADKARAAVPNGVSLGIYRQISFIAYLELPKSYSKAKRAWLTGQPHLGRIDGDNILKAIQDSLFKQDCVIWKFSGEKRWQDSGGARIEVELK